MLTSEMGHFRTWRIVLPESVVRSKADISQALPMSLDLWPRRPAVLCSGSCIAKVRHTRSTDGSLFCTSMADPARFELTTSAFGGQRSLACTFRCLARLCAACCRSASPSTQYRLVIDLGDLLRSDPEARWASWQRAGLAGVLSPNDVRTEEGWPRSSDPTADSIQPPAMGGAKPGESEGDDKPAPPSDDEGEGGKVARLDQRRASHVPA
jgi:hypothetical protein